MLQCLHSGLPLRVLSDDKICPELLSGVQSSGSSEAVRPVAEQDEELHLVQHGFRGDSGQEAAQDLTRHIAAGEADCAVKRPWGRH